MKPQSFKERIRGAKIAGSRQSAPLPGMNRPHSTGTGGESAVSGSLGIGFRAFGIDWEDQARLNNVDNSLWIKKGTTPVYKKPAL